MANTSARSRASQLFFFVLIMLQIPLFRVPCRTGTCWSPLQVTAAQLATSRIVPSNVVRAMLYPGAFLHARISKSTALPCWSGLFEQYNLHDISATQILELNCLELLVGSYFAVAGAVAGLWEPGKMSFFGVMLSMWGLIKEGCINVTQGGEQSSVYISPLMLLAVICVLNAVKFHSPNVHRQIVKAS